jgi:penicillin-binding protein 1A
MAATPPHHQPLPFEYAPPPATRRRMRLRKTRLAIAALVWLALGLSALVYGFMTALAQDLPQFEVAQLAQQSNGVIYADDGKTVLGVLRSDQYRVLVHWNEIAPVMRNAVVSIEDRRFFHHGAIDPVGMGRAVVVNIWTGSLAQGGSTITQQLVKNRWHPAQAADRSLRRKIIESALAYQVEQHWSKQKILEEYLNTIYFGHQAYGVEAAAEVYFGVHAKNLQPHQAALLAALIQNPTANDPLLHPKIATERRNLVLGKLLEQGYIDSFEYQLADSKPLLPRDRAIGFPAEKKTIANYFVDYVRQQLINVYGRQRALGGGLRVYTTLNPRMQRLALKAVRATLPKRRPEAALVAINPPTGEVRAMVGGRDYTNSVYGKFNLATDAVRQPGSAFKMFVLIAALEEGILPQTQFNSHRLLLDLPGRAVWSVTNDEGAYRGNIPLTTATTYSDNTVFAQLALRIGTERIRRVAHQMGIARPVGADPAIALGGLRHCCTPIEMALAYSTLANGGVRVTGSLPVRKPGPGEVPDPTLTPIAIRRVEDSTGKLIDRNKPQKVQAVSHESALQAIEMLRSVVRIGTAKLINSFPRPVAGKTGTTEDFVDAWFVGMTPTLTTAVWNGFPTIRVPMLTQYKGGPVFGGTYPALLWKAFTQAALEGTPKRNWGPPTPVSGAEIMIDPATGKRAGPNCPRARAVVMAYAKMPTATSSCTGTVIATPEVTSATARQAELTLDRAGLLPTIVQAVPPAGERAGHVFAQAPEPGEPIELGSRVTVSVAKPVTWVTVPDLIGLNVVAARSALHVAGFKVHETRGGYGKPAGRVYSQYPIPLKLAAKGALITLIVSDGTS